MTSLRLIVINMGGRKGIFEYGRKSVKMADYIIFWQTEFQNWHKIEFKMSLENLYILKYVLKGNVIWYIWPLNIIGIYFKESHSYHAQKSAYGSASLFPKSQIYPRFRALGIPLNVFSVIWIQLCRSVFPLRWYLYIFLVFVQL